MATVLTEIPVLAFHRLELQLDPDRPVSEDEFWRICQANPQWDLERTADGKVAIMAPAGFESDRRCFDIGLHLVNWNNRTKPGVCAGSSAGFALPNTAVVSPDVAWVSHERLAPIPVEDRERFIHVCPDFVVEVASPSQTSCDLQPKMRQYIEQGTHLARLIDPRSGVLEIDRPGRDIEVLQRPETLSGEDVLPGFVLPLLGILFA